MGNAFKTLSFTADGPIATLTLTRPDVLNRIDELTSAELAEVFAGLRRPRDIRVMVFASSGRAFSAGGDVNEVLRLTTDYELMMDAWELGRRLFQAVLDLPVPMVVALHGDVYGLASSLVLAGDVIVASKNARIGDPHVRIGAVAGDGGCAVWPSAFGMARAKRHLLTGEPIGAEEAHRLGGVSDLVEAPDEVLPLAQKIAGQIAALPPMAVQHTKRALNHAMQRTALDVFEFSLALEQMSLVSEDLKEAIDAFKTKRTPNYRNR